MGTAPIPYVQAAILNLPDPSLAGTTILVDTTSTLYSRSCISPLQERPTRRVKIERKNKLGNKVMRMTADRHVMIILPDYIRLIIYKLFITYPGKGITILRVVAPATVGRVLIASV